MYFLLVDLANHVLRSCCRRLWFWFDGVTSCKLPFAFDTFWGEQSGCDSVLQCGYQWYSRILQRGGNRMMTIKAFVILSKQNTKTQMHWMKMYYKQIKRWLFSSYYIDNDVDWCMHGYSHVWQFWSVQWWTLWRKFKLSINPFLSCFGWFRRSHPIVFVHTWIQSLATVVVTLHCKAIAMPLCFQYTAANNSVDVVFECYSNKDSIY